MTDTADETLLNRNKTVYVAGPMTGLPDWNYPAFHEASSALRSKGFVVFNPAEIPDGPSKTREQCMRTALKMLLQCDYIYLLPGWENSKGACLEFQVAEQIGAKVLNPILQNV